VGHTGKQNPQCTHFSMISFEARVCVSNALLPSVFSIISAIRLHPQTGPDSACPSRQLILDRFHHAERVPALPMVKLRHFFRRCNAASYPPWVFQLHAQELKRSRNPPACLPADHTIPSHTSSARRAVDVTCCPLNSPIVRAKSPGKMLIFAMAVVLGSEKPTAPRARPTSPSKPSETLAARQFSQLRLLP